MRSIAPQPTALVVRYNIKSIADEDVMAVRHRELALMDAVADFRARYPNAILTENVTWHNHGVEGQFLLASASLALILKLSL